MIRHEKLLNETLRLAKKGMGFVSPNPMVGSVIVRDGNIVAKGYHHYYGGDHAEVDALKKAGSHAKNAVVYVNLEPCSHFGKTPPCAEALCRAGVSEVIVGDVDPNPRVAGRGIKILRDSGIKVTTGVLTEKCRELNKVFYKYMQHGIPYVTLKLAMSLDGRITDKPGQAVPVTGIESRRRVHRFRSWNDSILVGMKTAVIDDPELTVRLVKGRSPKRIVLDPKLDCPVNLKLFNKNEKTETVFFCNQTASPDRIKKYENAGAGVIQLDGRNPNNVDLKTVLKKLGDDGISSLLVEGGANIASSFLAAGLVDYCYLFYSPRFFGKGLPGITFSSPGDASDSFEIEKVKRYGSDICLSMKKKL